VRGARAAILLALAALPTAAQDKVIDVRAGRVPENSFEALWAAYRRAEGSGDAERARRLFDEIRDARIERNIRSLEELGLALVSRGLDRLDKGDRAGAEDEFRRAVAVDPHLPDGYFGLALTGARKGPLGIVPAARDAVIGMLARASTSRGEFYLTVLVSAVLLLASFATTCVFGLALVLRHGTLLLHDLEERFGAARSGNFAIGVCGVLLLLPVLTFQGYGWLPLWWIALLFVYASSAERVVGALVIGSTLLIGPALELVRERTVATKNPLFRAAVVAMEGGGDRRALLDMEAAVRQQPDDRDLQYLLAILYKKTGQYEESAAIYRDILRADAGDRMALNNLANLDFAQQAFPAAITRYKLAKAGGDAGGPELLGTIYYNLALAHLQKFERQEADEARSQADRLAGGLTREYDVLWKYEARNENAVVDLGLSPEQVWAKFAGRPSGVRLKNLAGHPTPGMDGVTLLGSLANRFAGFLLVFAVVHLAMHQWRGKRTFTMHCLKCETPFCKRCHLGAAPAGLCTQCFHLFVVRDGVSGPARNQKLLEVQREDERREKMFRSLSLLSPGAGHLYAQSTLMGIVLSLAWYLLLSLVLLAGRVLPVTEAPAGIASRASLVAAIGLMLVVYVVANRSRPDFEVALPSPRLGRRGRAA
jgi:tetratricopeptide (TPR) repeat protein